MVDRLFFSRFAFSQVLKRRIEVHAVGMPLLIMGEDHPGPALKVCYMRHAFGLGEHYNSVQPLSSTAQEV